MAATELSGRLLQIDAAARVGCRWAWRASGCTPTPRYGRRRWRPQRSLRLSGSLSPLPVRRVLGLALSARAQPAAAHRARSRAGRPQHPDRVVAAAARGAGRPPPSPRHACRRRSAAGVHHRQHAARGRGARRLRNGAAGLHPAVAFGVGRRSRSARAGGCAATTSAHRQRGGRRVRADRLCSAVRRRRWRPSPCPTDETAASSPTIDACTKIASTICSTELFGIAGRFCLGHG